MRVDRMSPLDASFLHIEDGVSHMHIASVGIFEGPEPPFVELQSMIERKLALVPRYRCVIRHVPLELGRPVWIDDPHFNIEYHVRHTALPSPGGEAELRKLVGRVMSQPLDRSKPLWEIWVVEGLDEGNWAVLSKTHHAMVDGVSGTDVLGVIMDRLARSAIDRRLAVEAQPAPVGPPVGRRCDRSNCCAAPTSSGTPSGMPSRCPGRRSNTACRWCGGSRR